MYWIAYQKPKDLVETRMLLGKTGGRGRVIAGGTDLLLQLKRGEHHTDFLIDISGIEELKQIREENDWIRIGAGVTHGEIAQNPLILREARALAQGCGQMGSPQIRNVATLVGNVISAQPAGDGAIPLMALDSELKVVSSKKEHWIPLEEAYCDIGRSTVDPTEEVATEVRFKKLGENAGTEFFRMARRKALALPVLNGAVAIALNPGMDRIEKARIVIGPVAEKPFRPRRAEAHLESGAISPEIISEAARIASEEANPRTSLLRGSGAYRREMVKVNLIRAIWSVLNEVRKKR